MAERRSFSNLGIHVYGLAAICIGLLGIVSRDFAAVWQPVPDAFPHRRALACLFALCFLFGGVVIQWKPRAHLAAALLTLLYFISALLWLPRVIGFPRDFGTWNGFAEELALAAAGLTAFAMLAPANPSWRIRVAQTGRYIVGVCIICFGVSHFTALKFTATMVPAWIPPGGMFWAFAVGVFHIMAGLAILTGLPNLDVARLAARLETLMLILFGLLVWLPTLATNLHAHFVWAANAINLALASAVWVIADWITQSKTSRT